MSLKNQDFVIILHDLAATFASLVILIVTIMVSTIPIYPAKDRSALGLHLMNYGGMGGGV